MIWLTWRQYRTSFLVVLGLSIAFAAWLLYLGHSIRSTYTDDILGCVAADGCVRSDAEHSFLQQFEGPVTIASTLLFAVPMVIGLFWGAPLVSREFETDTHRLVWNQSVTRTRWLAVKLGITALLGLALTGALSALLTWAASRYDQLQATRFGAISFPARNIAPIGYVAFALAVGVAVGLVIRRTVPAMAVTLAILGIVAVVMPTVVRPHLRTPVTSNIAYGPGIKEHADLISLGGSDAAKVIGYSVPGALTLGPREALLLTSTGKQVSGTDIKQCTSLITQGLAKTAPDRVDACLAKRNLHITVTYQPAGRYWSFQWIEFAGFLVLAFLVSAGVLWRIRHVRG